MLFALWFVRHRAGHDLRTPRRVLAAALFIALAGGMVGTGQVMVNLASDYHVQTQFLDAKAAAHGEAPALTTPAESSAGTSLAGTPVAPAAGHDSATAQKQQLDVIRHAARRLDMPALRSAQ